MHDREDPVPWRKYWELMRKYLREQKRVRELERAAEANEAVIRDLRERLSEAHENLRGNNAVRLVAARTGIPQEAVRRAFCSFLDSDAFRAVRYPPTPESHK